MLNRSIQNTYFFPHFFVPKIGEKLYKTNQKHDFNMLSLFTISFITKESV